MLLSSGINKIHVCAPSNAAVDEILARLSVNGVHGFTHCEDDLKRTLLRIGAMEYEPAPAVKIHTLDERLRETLHDARVYELREKIKAPWNQQTGNKWACLEFPLLFNIERDIDKDSCMRL